jgi:capsule biosynthesis phosphatase
MKRLIMDVDDTICHTGEGGYSQSVPVWPVIEQIKKYKAQGFEIVLYSSRNVNTFKGNLGRINAHTLPVMIDWLERHGVPFDEIYVGKPWCGHEGFYVDDKAVRPAEFVSRSYEEIRALLTQSAADLALLETR